jgi:transposase
MNLSEQEGFQPMQDTEQEYQKQIKELEQQVRLLREQVDFLTRKLYGTKSEKTSALEIEGQMSLFNEMESCAEPDAHEPDLVEVEKHLRKRKYAGQREKLIKDIPRSKVLHTIDESEQICERCGGTMVKVGEEFVRTEVQFIPASLKVVDHYRETYECRACRKNGTPYMEKSPVPHPPVMHSLASASTIAWLVHQKFELGIPLYRQEKEWEAMGLSLSRATMSNWLLAVCRDWLSHVVSHLRRELLKQGYLHIDETHVQVLKEPGRKNTSDSYMWVYCSTRDSKRPVRYFEYQPGRGGKYPETFLKGYTGYIHTDAYSGYNGVKGVTRCLCYTHLRRAFVDALPKDIHGPEASKPAEAVIRLNKLFEIEKELDGLPPEQKKKERLDREKPLLEAFWSWAEISSAGELPKSKLHTALQYALNNRQEFFNYLGDGNCSISNSLAENCIRPFVIGRKNWLFAGSPKGAAASAGIYTLVETAKANGLDAMKYIKYILADMPGSRFLENPEYLDDYLPWDPMVQERCR